MAAIIASSYVTAERALYDLANRAMSLAGTDSVEHLQGFFRPARDAALLTERLAEHEVLRTDDPSSMERYFYSQLQNTPWLDGIFYGRQDGSFVFVRADDIYTDGGYYTKVITVDGDVRRVEFIIRDSEFGELDREGDPVDTFDPRQRPWFQAAIADDGLTWTQPYVFFTSGHPGISTAVAVRDEAGAVAGVVGVDIIIDDIADFLSSLKTGEHGAAYVFNRAGDVIAFPDVETVTVETGDLEGGLRFATVDDLAVPAAKAAILSLGEDPAALDLTGEVFSRFDAEGRTYVSIAVPYPLEEWRWVLGLYFPEDLLLREVRENRALNAALAAAIGVIACVVGILVWRSVARFAAALSHGARAVEAGRYDEAWTFRSGFREFSETAAAFGGMFEAVRQREADNTVLTDSLRSEIAAHEQTEQDLRKSEEMYALAMAGTKDGLWDWDIDGDRILLSPRLSDMLGMGAGVRHLSAAAFREMVHGEDRDAYRAALAEHLKARQGHFFHSCRLTRPDGTAFWALIRGLALWDKEGRAYRMAGSVTDETGRRIAEERLRRSERMEALGSLAGGIAHEFNNRLVPMVAYTELVRDELPDGSDARKQLDQVLEAAEASQDLIEQILTFGRERPARRESIVVQDAIESALALLRPTLPACVELTARLSGGAGVVLADSTQIQTVVLNLCSNAAQAIGPDGGRIAVTLDRRMVNSDAEGAALGVPPGDYVELAVADTGPGLGRETMDRIFDPFFTTKPEGEGTGLGLAIVSGIVVDMGGAIAVESQLERGATFRVILPRLGNA